MIQRSRLRHLMIVSALFAAGAVAEDARERDLDELRDQIRSTEADRRRLQSDTRKAVASLKEQELALAAASERLSDLNEAIAQKQADLQSLALRYQEREKDLHAERQDLARLLRANYMLGTQNPLKLLLSQEDPHAASRLLVYHALITRARAQRLAAVTRDLTETRAYAEAMRLERERLLLLQSGQDRSVKDMEALRTARKTTLAALEGDLEEKARRLRGLRTEKRALEGLLESLPGWSTTLAVGTGHGLGDLRGLLSWPVKGRIARRFGEPSGSDSELTLRGVFIEAPAGGDVQAVGNGLVVFADWFQGFGLLVIIDHGAGWMSLYGHNQSFRRKPGEAVSRGDIIAAVGDSGGLTGTGVYFELRQQGVPQDPSQWCR